MPGLRALVYPPQSLLWYTRPRALPNIPGLKRASDTGHKAASLGEIKRGGGDQRHRCM
eukprot:COSAG02_NODE_55353_length_291_cov_0.541667_1_plen_57_part_10